MQRRRRALCQQHKTQLSGVTAWQLTVRSATSIIEKRESTKWQKNIGLYTEKLNYAKRENWRCKWRAKWNGCAKTYKTETRHGSEQATKKLMRQRNKLHWHKQNNDKKKHAKIIHFPAPKCEVPTIWAKTWLNKYGQLNCDRNSETDCKLII